MIFLAPFSVGRHGVSQAPHSILSFRNGQSYYHKLIAELPVHHYDARVTASNICHLLAERSNYLVLGGDHSITLGILRARAEEGGPVHLVMFDAHSDDYQLDHVESVHPLHSGNWLNFAVEEGLVDGVSWFNYRGERLKHFKGSSKAHDRIHVTVDIDVLSPPEYGFATPYPEAGGCSLNQLLDDIAKVGSKHRGANITADLVEYDPTRDPTQAGAWACSKITTALLSIIQA